MTITDKQAAQLRAVRDCRDHGGIRPREFARAVWPHSPGWQRVARCGPGGSHRGGGMYLAGGAALGKLRAAGLVRTNGWPSGFTLTEAGRKALDAWEAGQED